MLTFFFHFVALNSKSEVRSTHLRLGTHNLQSKQTQNNCATMKLVTILVFPFFSFTFVCISVLFKQRSEQTMSHIDFQGNHNDAWLWAFHAVGAEFPAPILRPVKSTAQFAQLDANRRLRFRLRRGKSLPSFEHFWPVISGIERERGPHFYRLAARVLPPAKQVDRFCPSRCDSNFKLFMHDGFAIHHRGYRLSR